MGLLFHVFPLHRAAEVADLHSVPSEDENSLHIDETWDIKILFLMVLSLDCSYVVIKVAARIAITKPSLRALFFLDISTHLVLSWTPTLSHASGFAIYTDVRDKGPSNAQRFVFCLSSPHHSLMTLTDMALTVFIFFLLHSPYFMLHKELWNKDSSKSSLHYIYLHRAAFLIY